MEKKDFVVSETVACALRDIVWNCQGRDRAMDKLQKGKTRDFEICEDEGLLEYSDRKDGVSPLKICRYEKGPAEFFANHLVSVKNRVYKVVFWGEFVIKVSEDKTRVTVTRAHEGYYYYYSSIKYGDTWEVYKYDEANREYEIVCMSESEYYNFTMRY